MCDVDRKYERLDQFSNKAQKMIAEAKRRHRPQPKVKCRKHTEGVVTELYCDTCHVVKPLGDFSNAARKHTNQARCRDCTSWTETDVGQTVPLPGPMMDRAPDETDLGRKGEDEYDTDEEEATEFYNNLNNLTLSDDLTDVGHGQANEGSTTETLHKVQDGSHGQGGFEASSAPSVTSDVTSSAGTEHLSLPTSGLAMGAHYNAWGPDGQRELRTRSITAGSSTTGSTGDSNDVATSRSGFAKVAGRRRAPDAPGYILNKHPDEIQKSHRYTYESSDSEDEC